ncbi:Hemerythrin HHE cation binding domain-containing protein [Sporobacter termitidis DSM 10068]|uniref:Hemerythrin HHE cation binding domain-containing protein n=1 Tax=Sporobacter termitidis DSM 10068 TaxID=1123282 RepID=A0A1M5ZD62_9FIRM|nr:hemerythrin domain-containing protein [Sporobacter termitidis]SHI22165.1 Hemerythrin HHE cation binding domain-containing protein [Sporobacter termitidis DSM 10068]
MRNLDLLRRQHDEILAIIGDIEGLIRKNDPAKTAPEMALAVNTLSGKLKMHLLSEDQHLYPALMDSSDPALKSTASDFYAEMGHLAETFAKFVQDYNVPAKILRDTGKFAADSKKVFDAVKNRISRESSRLYPLAEG